jgi:hypothetical protein
MEKHMRQALVIGMLLVAASAYAQIQLVAALTGDGEPTPVVTAATGTGSFVFNDDLTELKYIVSYQGLSGTLTAGGHFHVGTPGRSGPIVKAIALSGDPASNTVSGTWKTSDASQPLTPALVESLLTGRVYVNFHTAANPGGEIRGQVTLGTALQFVANLDGVQEIPQNTELGTGTGVFVLSTDMSEIEYHIAYQGLTGPLTAGGHIHLGAAGRSGGIVKQLASSGDPASGLVQGSWRSSDGTQPFTPALLDSLIAGKLYANFHTAAHGGGEIRGQLLLAGGTGFAAKLEAGNEVPAVTEDGKGIAYIILNAARTEARYAVTYFGLTGTLTAGGHFHTGTADRTGPVVKGIAVSGGAASATLSGFWRRGDATQPLTTALAESLLSGRLYINFHTAAHGSGEIRGQWDMTTGVGFSVSMDGANESTPVVTAARSSGYAILNGERHDLRYRFTYHGLSGTLTAGGHFHTGAPGVPGPVVKAIASSGDPAAGTVGGDWSSSDATQPLTPALADSILAGKIYANYHTAANPGGEIRGQLAFPTDAATGVDQDAANAPASFALFQNYPNPFNPSTTISFQLAEAGPVELTVYNLLGEQVAQLVNEVKAPGMHSVSFGGIALASGTYFYQLRDGRGQMQVRRMLLVK